MKKKNIGGSFDDFLREEGLYEKTAAVATKRVLARQTAREIEKPNESGTNRLA